MMTKMNGNATTEHTWNTVTVMLLMSMVVLCCASNDAGPETHDPVAPACQFQLFDCARTTKEIGRANKIPKDTIVRIVGMRYRGKRWIYQIRKMTSYADYKNNQYRKWTNKADDLKELNEDNFQELENTNFPSDHVIIKCFRNQKKIMYPINADLATPKMTISVDSVVETLREDLKTAQRRAISKGEEVISLRKTQEESIRAGIESAKQMWESEQKQATDKVVAEKTHQLQTQCQKLSNALKKQERKLSGKKQEIAREKLATKKAEEKTSVAEEALAKKTADYNTLSNQKSALETENGHLQTQIANAEKDRKHLAILQSFSKAVLSHLYPKGDWGKKENVNRFAANLPCVGEVVVYTQNNNSQLLILGKIESVNWNKKKATISYQENPREGATLKKNTCGFDNLRQPTYDEFVQVSRQADDRILKSAAFKDQLARAGITLDQLRL